MSLDVKPDKIDEIVRDPERARKTLEIYASGSVPETSLEAWLLGLLFCVRYFLYRFYEDKKRFLKPTPTLVLMDLGLVSKGDELNLFTKRQKICLDYVEYCAWIRMMSQLHALARRVPSHGQKIIALINSLSQAMVGNCLKVYNIDVLINYMSTIYTIIRTIIEESRLEKYTRKRLEEEGEEP